MAISKIILNGVTQMDVTQDTVTHSTVLSGETATGADGVRFTGTYSGGGGIAEQPEKDVNFIDYDGTIVYSYTTEEFLALSALPSNPSHSGLTAQGWNWTLSDAQDYVTANKQLIIGQHYITTSGKTEFDIVLTEALRSIYLQLCVSGTISINWGDNSTPTTVTGNSSSTAINTNHVYSTPGNYTISIEILSGLINIKNTYNIPVINGNVNDNATNLPWAGTLRKVRLGPNAYTSGYAFAFTGLCSITIPINHVVNGYLESSHFLECHSLTALVFSPSCTHIGGSCFESCSSLRYVSFSNTIVSFEGGYSRTFYYNYSLSMICFPDTTTTIPNYGCYDCRSLKRAIIPEGATSVHLSSFDSCTMLSEITLPSTLTTIASGAFMMCMGLREIHFKSTTPPSVVASDAFFSLQTSCVIYVPSGTLAAYESATNYPDPQTYTYVEE